MPSRIDRLWPLTWSESGLRPDGFHNPDNDSAPSGEKKCHREPKVTQVGRFATQKRGQNHWKMWLSDDFFVKRPTCDPLAPAQSKHGFCHVILSRFRPQCRPGSSLKLVRKILMQNSHLLCTLGWFWVPRALPKPPPGDHFAINFATFCMTWADDLPRLVQTSTFNRKATLQTYKSAVLHPKWSSW